MVMSVEEKRAARKRIAQRCYLKNRARTSARRKQRRAADPVLRAILDSKATAFRNTHKDAVNATRRARAARLRAMEEPARVLERQARADAARLQRLVRQREARLGGARARPQRGHATLASATIARLIPKRRVLSMRGNGRKDAR